MYVSAVGCVNMSFFIEDVIFIFMWVGMVGFKNNCHYDLSTTRQKMSLKNDNTMKKKLDTIGTL